MPETSWEWEGNLYGCLELLKDYLQKIGEQGRVLPPELTSEVPAGTSGGSPQPTTSAQAPPPRTTSQDSGSGAGSPPPRHSTRLQQRGAAP